jgi:hypothetical protein
MLFKKGDKFTLVVKNDTHKGDPNKSEKKRQERLDRIKW